MEIKTRFAPSPTGSLHLGGARTAVFNWLFARHHNGSFVLRIEDTDRARSTQESLEEILDSLKWLGLEWDDKPVKQSERLGIYRDHAFRLLESGKAYRCYMTAEELEQKRKEARERGEYFQYKREWSRENSNSGEPYAIRLATPETGDIKFNDILRGIVSFDAAEIDDFIILRADGFPTYNFAVAIDDALMKISHVIRGDDHLINTPRQKLIYDSLGYDMPETAHVSMIFGEDKTKLSKRHGAVSVNAYRDKGYLPEAMVNYLARLGWSHGDQEIFSREELIEKFTLKNVGKSPAVFNPEKLLWVNSHHIKNKDTRELADILIPFYRKYGYDVEADDRFLKIVEQLKNRSKTLKDFVEQSDYFFNNNFEYSRKDFEKFLTPDNAGMLQAVHDRLDSLSSFDHDSIHNAFGEVMNDTGLKLGKIAQPVRVALTGGTSSPGIFDVVEILGKEETLKRLRKAIELIKN